MSKQALYAKFTPKEGKRDEVIAALKPMFEQIGNEPGTEVYAMHEGTDGSVWFYELDSDSDAFKAHAGSEAMKAAFGRLSGLLEGQAEIVLGTPAQAKGLAV
jgi:quinol monooxygenase YgiN